MTRYWDISPPISAELAVWPGDVPYRHQVSLSTDRGDHMTLSAIETTVHLGAHTDAPNHYLADAQGIGERDLGAYYGTCQVMRVEVRPGERLLPAHLTADIAAPRVIFRTDTFPDPTCWNDDFASLSPALVDHLADAGVRLVGIDTPSVDPMRDADLHAHQAIARHDMAILEGVCLSEVPDGLYTLVALPLRLMGADASPVRAILLPADR